MRKPIVIFCFLLLVDQLLKYFFSAGNVDFSFWGFFTFSLSREHRLMGWLLPGPWFKFILISIYLIILIFIGLNKNFTNQSKIALVFVLAGMTGNLIDRVFLGYVSDYIGIGNLGFFNLADVMIVVGVLGVLVNLKCKYQKSRIISNI